LAANDSILTAFERGIASAGGHDRTMTAFEPTFRTAMTAPRPLLSVMRTMARAHDSK
jgi:hypothetical protein